MGPLAKTPFRAYPVAMRALPLVLALALPARAGVATSAEAGSEATVPKISLQTTLSPTAGPGLAPTLTPGLVGTLSAPAIVDAKGLPAPLPVSAVQAAQAQAVAPALKPVALNAAKPAL